MSLVAGHNQGLQLQIPPLQSLPGIGSFRQVSFVPIECSAGDSKSGSEDIQESRVTNNLYVFCLICFSFFAITCYTCVLPVVN